MKFNLYKSILFAVPAIMGLTAMQAQTTKEVKPGINVTFLIQNKATRRLF
jgi:hypothetical protein